MQSEIDELRPLEDQCSQLKEENLSYSQKIDQLAVQYEDLEAQNLVKLEDNTKLFTFQLEQLQSGNYVLLDETTALKEQLIDA